MNNINSKLKVVELFSGIGAWSKALRNLHIDYDLVYAVEQDDLTMKVFNKLNGTNFNSCEIQGIKETEVPECDLIFYSPPCQPFSTVGKKMGFKDKRGVLFFDALRIIREKKPKYAIMENVIALSQKKFENEFNEMLDELEQSGYKNYWSVENAQEHGIPQSRKRVFVVSIRRDIINEFTFKNKSNDLRDVNSYILNEVENRFIIDKDWADNLIKESEVKIGDTKVVSFTRKKLKETNIVNTLMSNPPLRCLGNNTPISGVLMLNGKLRTLTPLETWRFMGFDDKDYYTAKETVSKYYNVDRYIDGKLYKLSGNSIVVQVIEDILKKLFNK